MQKVGDNILNEWSYQSKCLRNFYQLQDFYSKLDSRFVKNCAKMNNIQLKLFYGELKRLRKEYYPIYNIKLCQCEYARSRRVSEYINIFKSIDSQQLSNGIDNYININISIDIYIY